MADFSIRGPEAGDADAIGRVLVEAAIGAWGSFVGEERIREANAGRSHPADLVAVERDGSVVGFVAWDASTGEVSHLYVHPSAQGRGAGAALLSGALDALRAAGRTQAWLNTEGRSTAIRGFYERLGWRVEGPPRVRDWHGVHLVEPRYVLDLVGARRDDEILEARGPDPELEGLAGYAAPELE